MTDKTITELRDALQLIELLSSEIDNVANNLMSSLSELTELVDELDGDTRLAVSDAETAVDASEQDIRSLADRAEDIRNILKGLLDEEEKNQQQRPHLL